MTFAFRMEDELGARPDDSVRAFAVATAVVRPAGAVGAPGRADRSPTAVSDRVVLVSRRLLDRAARWFLTNRPQPLAVGAAITRFAGPVRELRAAAARAAGRARVRGDAGGRGRGSRPRASRPGWRARRRCCSTATGCSTSSSWSSSPTARRSRATPFEVAQLYFAMSEHLGIDPALTAVSELERGDRWHSLARLSLRDDLYGSLRAVTLDALREAPPGTPVDETIAQWERANASRLLRARPALDQILTGRAARPRHAVGGVPAAARPGPVTLRQAARPL